MRRQNNMSKQVIGIKELSDLNKWLEVLKYSEFTNITSLELYLNTYRKGEGMAKETPGDWLNIFDTLVEGIYFEDWNIFAEVFIRLIETHYKTSVTNGKDLEALTKTKPEQYNEDLKVDIEGELEGLVKLSNHFRYQVYLYYLLSVTKNYSDLLKIEPSEFNLPEEWLTNWKETTPLNKEQMILKTLFFKYDLDTSTGIELGRAPLRDIANHCKAPYSVILKAQKVY